MPALGDLFAPAYTKSDPNSVQEVQTWMDKNRSMTPEMVEQTRMPIAGVNTGNAAGTVDPAALRALSQGGAYDIGARRNEIAAAAQAQQQAAAAKPANPWARYGMIDSPYGQLYANQYPGSSPLIGLMGGDGSTFF